MILNLLCKLRYNSKDNGNRLYTFVSAYDRVYLIYRQNA